MPWRKIVNYAVFTFFSILYPVSAVFPAEKIEKYIPDAAASQGGMTLWQIIKSGGEIMIILAFLSIAALALIIYYFLMMKQEKLLPRDFLNKTVTLVEEKKYDDAITLCKANSNLISNVMLVGLSRVGHEKIIVREAIEDTGRRTVTDLWQKLSYLADIAAIAPMVGLYGTVVGMIQAFNAIAFQPGAVKPILLAYGISKAMITTAAGLTIAIPAMIFYSYFRGIVQSITTQFENIASELAQLVTEGKRPYFGA
jgi:biopolymer transport protein ExbB